MADPISASSLVTQTAISPSGVDPSAGLGEVSASDAAKFAELMSHQVQPPTPPAPGGHSPMDGVTRTMDATGRAWQQTMADVQGALNGPVTISSLMGMQVKLIHASVMVDVTIKGTSRVTQTADQLTKMN